MAKPPLELEVLILVSLRLEIESSSYIIYYPLLLKNVLQLETIKCLVLPRDKSVMSVK